MADRKQYEMLFALNASMNGNFQGTFSKAQQEFSKLSKEIQELQKLQSNVSSYQKQEQAIASTSAKLSNLQQQHDLLQKEINETTGSTANLEREKLRLEQRIKDTETALDRQRQKLDATGQKLQEAGVDTANLTSESQRLAAQMQELSKRQEEAANSAQSFGQRAVQGFEAVQSAITASGITEALGGIKDAYLECVEAAAGFEESMSNVEALSGAAAQEMAELNAKAKELGADTKFTAKESADAMGYMAMAGWNAQQMISGMDGVINLAAASGEDLAQVSDIVTDNLTAFGMKASDTARFADVLAAAATNSNTSVSIMGETFKNSAAIAGALGYSVEDVAVAVGLMANAGVKGSNAGTALKNTLNGLVSGVTLTSAAFGEYEFSAVRADGTMKDFAATIDELRECFDQMTEAERFSNAQAIAGERTYNGLLAILNATDEDYASLTQSINECSGAAQRMADIKMDNLNGQLTLMDSAWDALRTTIGEQFNPELRELAGLGTDVLSWINGFVQENPALTKGIMAGAGAFGVMGTAVVGVNAALKVFKALNVAALFTGPAGVLLGVAGGIAAVTAAAVGMNEALRDGGPAVRELTEAARGLDDALAEAESTYKDAASSSLAAADVANHYIDKLEEMGDAAQLSGDEQKRYQNTLALLLDVMPTLSNSIKTTTDEYGRATYTLETTTEALRANTEEWKNNARAQAYQEYLSAIMDQYNDVLLEAAENEIGLTKAQYALDAAAKKYADTEERMKVLYGEAEAAAASYNKTHTDQKTAIDLLTPEYYQLENALVDLEHEMAYAGGEADNYREALAKDADAVAEAEAEMAAAEKAVDELTGAMGGYADGQSEVAAAAGPLQEALTGSIASVQALAQSYTEAYESAVESFSGQFGLFDEAKADAEATVAAAQAALDTQLAYWQGYAENIAALKEISAGDLGVTEENYNALMEYVRSGTPEAAGLAADMVKAVNDGNTQALTDLANTLGEISESQDLAAQNVADWTTGLTDQMDQLIGDMEEDIGALDLSEDAAESGRATIQAYIDAAGDMLPQVQDAYRRLASAAVSSMGYIPYTDSAYHANGNTNLYGGFASGTDNAPPGWAWVGEEGPELMRLHGGEAILPAQVSQEYAALTAYANEAGAYTAASANMAAVPTVEAVPASYDGAAGSITVEVHIHLEGNASAETVQALEDYVSRGELKAAVIDAMEEVQADTMRGAYV